MNRLELRKLIKEELDNRPSIYEVGASDVMHPRDVMKLLSRNSEVVGKNRFMYTFKILDVRQMNDWTDMKQLQKYDGYGDLKGVRNHETFMDKLDLLMVEPGDYLVACEHLESQHPNRIYVYGTSKNNGVYVPKNGVRENLSHPLKENYDRFFQGKDPRLVESSPVLPTDMMDGNEYQAAIKKAAKEVEKHTGVRGVLKKVFGYEGVLDGKGTKKVLQVSNDMSNITTRGMKTGHAICRIVVNYGLHTLLDFSEMEVV